MEEDKKKSLVFQAALAGLLHDVGKVVQRAKEDPWNPPEDVRDSGQPVHAAWSISLAKLLPQAYQAAALAGGYHHQPEKSPAQDHYVSKLVTLADKLSAGERSDLTKDYKTQKPPQQLVSIFDRIPRDGDKRLVEHYLPVAPLTLEEIGNYIQPENRPTENVPKAYDDLRDALETAVKKNIQDGEIYLEHVLAEMQRLTWCVPSAYYYSIADVSLYDHSRMTAALAACLSDFDQSKVDSLLGAVTRNFQDKPTNGDEQLLAQPVALLVGGDISGVQDFIYTITNKGATSALRGRSFYLQLLTEAATRFVLRELGLPYTNLIYGGGGNFYILARATDKDRLNEVRQKLSRILYKHHQGDLYIAIEGIPLAAKDFMRPKDKNPDGTEKRHPLSEKWGELARQVAVVKNQRFAELSAEELKVLFTPQGHGGNEDEQCQVCGREYTPGEQDTQDEKDKGKCAACLSYEDLGRDLRDAQYIAWRLRDHPKSVAPIQAGTRGGRWHEVLNHLGFNVWIKDNLVDVPKDASWVWAVSDKAFKDAYEAKTFPVLVRRLLVNVTPKLSEPYKTDDGQLFNVGDIKPFEKLAKDSQGITRLGVFRADVDNLGKLFAEGLGADATLSRIAALSFHISLFFEGWVGEVAKSFNERRRKEDEKRKAEAREKGKSEKGVPLYGDALYAIYSGGDDLFFVGSWDEVVEFAWQVNEDLHKYTGGHPGIHISGGMALVTEKYPLAKAARDAEKAEKAAKSLEWWDEEAVAAQKPNKKNVFAFLGQPLPWSEFKHARELKKRLIDLDKSKRTAVIRKLLMNYALYAKAEEDRREKGKNRKKDGKPQTLYGPWNWRIVYLLRRTFGKESEKANSNEQTLITDFHTRPDMLEYTGVAARWAELEYRKRD
jgi:CRISPR-associated protein Csm1